MSKLNIIVVLLILLVTACFKEDALVPPHDSGNVETDTVAITEVNGNHVDYYKKQVYYDLFSGEEISQNNKDTWDLGFEASDEGWHIVLNTSLFMYAANTGLTDFSQAIDTMGLKWKFDKSDGNIDSTAIGNWLTFSSLDSSLVFPVYVYVINRGYDDQGNQRGLKKVVFEELKDGQYSFRFANLDGSNEISAVVSKDPSVNFVCFSFDEAKESLVLEPGKYEWDLLFTQYTTLLFTDQGEPYPYLVTGVLSNRTDVLISVDSLYNFNEIDRSLAIEMDFSTDQDKIGYDWKELVGDVNTGDVSYVINPDITYLIRGQQGFYYKLRFIGFYNASGIKGFPSFEFQRL